MNNIKILVQSIALGSTLLVATSASAQTYVLDSSLFNYRESDQLLVSIDTNQIGTFTTKAEIEDVLAQSTFKISLFNGAEKLTELTHLDTAWRLVLGSNATANLTITDSQFALTFFTPQEYTDARLSLQSANLTSIFQFSQSNNVSDYNTIHFGYNAVHSAYNPLNYGASFVLTAAVPEPSSYAMLALGLGLLGWAARRKA